MYKNTIKLMLDFFISFIFLIFLFPLLVFIAIYIKIISSGPIFFTQKRVGLNEKVFCIYKFRTMYVGAENNGIYSTKKNDERIYLGGKFLRLTSLDELPQLFNVLRGDMSFIGPRPDVLSQKSCYTSDEWSQRCSVKPGITGLSQVMGRSSLGSEKRKYFDLLYVRNISFGLDLKIILNTFLLLSLKKKAN